MSHFKRASIRRKRKTTSLVAYILGSLLLVNAAAAKSVGYAIGMQDKIRVTVVEWLVGSGALRSPINGEYTVGPGGSVSLPLIGDVPAVGLQPSAFAKEISKKIQIKMSLSETPTTSIEIVKFRPFFVMGEVEKPGEFEFRPGITVLRAISLAGGYRRVAFADLVKSRRELRQTAGRILNAHDQTVTLLARRERLVSEQKNLTAVAFSPELKARSKEPSVATAMRLEESIFTARRQAFQAALDAQRKLINLASEEQAATDAQGKSLREHQAVTEQQAKNLRSLQSRGLATMGRDFEVARQIAEVIIRQQVVRAESAKLKQERVRAEEKIEQIRFGRKLEIAKELQLVQTQIEEVRHRILAAEKELAQGDHLGKVDQGYTYRIMRRDPTYLVDRELAITVTSSLRAGDLLIIGQSEKAATSLIVEKVTSSPVNSQLDSQR